MGLVVDNGVNTDGGGIPQDNVAPPQVSNIINTIDGLGDTSFHPVLDFLAIFIVLPLLRREEFSKSDSIE